ncbi:MAG: acetolactate decarboxylase [Muricauda sp.]|nr:acetolactate decarboxylase [Allomuricauda sp.]
MNFKKFCFPILVSLVSMQLSAQMPMVHDVGAMNKMGNTYDINMWLDTISPKSHVYGMGPYDKMKGEITVVDSQPYYATAFVENAYSVGKSWDIRSPFFVYTNVDKWAVYQVQGPFNSVADIQEKVTTIAKEHGYDTSQPFAFKLKGRFDDITAHIVTPRNPDVDGYREGVKSQKFSFENAKGEFIGFYSEHHQGIYTHHDSFVHIHFLKKDKSFMGHLDNIKTANKTYKLYLPKLK